MQDRSPPARRNHLQRTAGPYIWVRSAGLVLTRKLPVDPSEPTSRGTVLAAAKGQKRSAQPWRDVRQLPPSIDDMSGCYVLPLRPQRKSLAYPLNFSARTHIMVGRGTVAAALVSPNGHERIQR
jgi:hypothetical protein